MKCQKLRLRDIDINRWYNVKIDDDYELCKIRLWSVYDEKAGIRVFHYAVTCYYTGKDLYIGPLADCRKWLAERISYEKY